METLRNYFTDEQIEIMESIHPGITEDPHAVARARAMRRCSYIYAEMQRQLADNHCNAADMVYRIRTIDGRKHFCACLSCLGTESLKARVLNLFDTHFVESAVKVAETKTTAVYSLGIVDGKGV